MLDNNKTLTPVLKPCEKKNRLSRLHQCKVTPNDLSHPVDSTYIMWRPWYKLT